MVGACASVMWNGTGRREEKYCISFIVSSVAVIVSSEDEYVSPVKWTAENVPSDNMINC